MPIISIGNYNDPAPTALKQGLIRWDSSAMDVLCASGAVTWRLAADKRVALFHVAAVYRPQPGVVDYGFCGCGLAAGRI